MPKAMDFDPVKLARADLARLLSYIQRARRTSDPERLELKAIINLERALRAAPAPRSPNPAGITATASGASRRAAPALAREREAPLPEIYGNHQLIPVDWRPSVNTVAWTEECLGGRKVAYDLNWLIAEFVTYWRGQGRTRANWQQAFRNNVLVKLSRGIPLAPARGANGPRRVYDKQAELTKQRLADFDRESFDLDRPDTDS